LHLSDNVRGAIFMIVATVGYTVNDAMTKFVTESMNMGQVMLIRGVFATLLIALLAWSRGAFAHRPHILNPLVLLRAAGEALATASFLVALAHIPLATTSAVMQALPLAVTMGAALVFGEQVHWRRWLAIAIGFGGVLIIVRPGTEGFNVYALLGAGVGGLLRRARPRHQAPARADPVAAGLDRDRGAGDGVRRPDGRPDGRLEPCLGHLPPAACFSRGHAGDRLPDRDPGDATR